MQIVEYRKEYKDAIIELLSGGDPAYRDWKRRIWDWEFERNPFITDISPILMMLIDGKLAGSYGSLPVLLKYGDSKIEALWGCDNIMRPELRGQGFGRLLIYANQARRPVILGLGVADRVANILEKSGRRFCTDIDEFFFHNKARGAKDLAKKVVQDLTRVRRLGGARDARELAVSVIPASQAPAEIDALWERVEGGYAKVVVRNRAYVQWKYGDHPLANYRLVLVRSDGELTGVGVFRAESESARLVDYVGPAGDMTIKRLIVARFMAECSDSALMSCICTDGELKTALKEAGFRKFHKQPRFYVYSGIPEDEEPERGWFVMAGDSDEDMLAAARDSLAAATR